MIFFKKLITFFLSFNWTVIILLFIALLIIIRFFWQLYSNIIFADSTYWALKNNEKNIIVVTGGAGFVGTNLIKKIINTTKYKVISIDNYTTGKISNHIKNNRITYIKSDTKYILKILNRKKNQLMLYFILENLLEFTKVFQIWVIVLILTQLVLLKFLSFV